MKRIVVLFSGICFLCSWTKCVLAGEWDWEAGAEYRYLTQNPPYGVKDDAVSVSVRSEYNHDWNDGDDLIELDAFYRWSEADEARRHGDISDLAWIHVGGQWELRSGIRTVFWGVTEFNHLVDIINQKDSVERIDGEARLGQPMVNLSMVYEWGIVDLFVLAGFRERTFPGENGWPRGPILFSNDDSDYESSQENKHIDFAARWAQSLGYWELALAYFTGTSRDPEFQRINEDGELVPYYALIDQVSLEAQFTYDFWLLKAEALNRSGQESGRYFAGVFGFEYTFEALFDGTSDLGLVMEYNYDERGEESPSDYFLENDIALGVRWGLNDVGSSQVLAGVIYDHKTHEQVWTVEAERRLGDVWTIRMDAVVFRSESPPSLEDFASGMFDPIYKLASSSRNDMVQLELIRYF